MEDESALETIEEISAESCASQCSLAKECFSFNFCAATAKQAKSKCTLTHKHPQVIGTKKVKQEGCRNYFKPLKPDPEKPNPEKPDLNTPSKDLVEKKSVPKPKNISGGKFTGIVFGMILTGLILGALGQMMWNRVKARREQSSGRLGLDVPSVRWVKQKEDNA